VAGGIGGGRGEVEKNVPAVIPICYESRYTATQTNRAAPRAPTLVDVSLPPLSRGGELSTLCFRQPTYMYTHWPYVRVLSFLFFCFLSFIFLYRFRDKYLFIYLFRKCFRIFAHFEGEELFVRRMRTRDAKSSKGRPRLALTDIFMTHVRARDNARREAGRFRSRRAEEGRTGLGRAEGWKGKRRFAFSVDLSSRTMPDHGGCKLRGMQGEAALSCDREAARCRCSASRSGGGRGPVR